MFFPKLWIWKTYSQQQCFGINFTVSVVEGKSFFSVYMDERKRNMESQHRFVHRYIIHVHVYCAADGICISVFAKFMSWPAGHHNK